jgi:hypothetical protein
MSESAFSKKLRNGLAEHGVKTERVESRATAVGIPDIYGIKMGFSFWIETKQNFKADRIRYEPLQALWLETEWKNGGMCLTILHHTATDEVIIVWGNDSRAAEKSIQGTNHIVIPFHEGWVDEVWDVIYSNRKH